MNKTLIYFLLLFSVLSVSNSASYSISSETKFPQNAWSKIKIPSLKPLNIYGSYANGCISGAVALPESGTGFYDMRRFRNRYYGHPDLIRFITKIGFYINKNYNRKLLIGDLSQPMGGKLNFGHTSHQIGLDVDIWLQTVDSKQIPKIDTPMLTIIDKKHSNLLKNQPTKQIVAAIAFAANDPQVERIFINPVIKKYFCQTYGNKSWLYKLRPWWGHDEHFHVRLACPKNSPFCQNQPPPEMQSGCDAELDNWIKEQADIANGKTVIKPDNSKKKLKKNIPSQCNDLLQTTQ